MASCKTEGSPQHVFNIPAKLASKRCPSKKRRLTDPVADFENNVEVLSSEKKLKALEVWVNKVLTPPVEFNDPNDDRYCSQNLDPKEIISAMSKATAKPTAPPPSIITKEGASLQLYVSRRWMDNLRIQAANLYLSLEPMFIHLDEAIDSKKVYVRPDRCIYKDVGVQRSLLKLLHSVYPLWLRVGLETVYGEEIQNVKDNKDRNGLTCFMLQRMFHDPELQKQYGYSSVVNYYKEDYGIEIAKFFIKKFLRLFIFLDRAKSSRLIKHDPCLFLKKSEHKTVKDVFTALTKEVISGDGNLFKVLAQVGFELDYVQTYVDEIHYFLNQLMVDLRDGVILCRLVELLTDEFTLMPKLRCPPISILQKIYNVQVALDALAAQNVETADIQAKKIVEGHRIKTMTLVNRMMLHFHKIKIGDGTAQLAETIIKFQASCRGFLARRHRAVGNQNPTGQLPCEAENNCGEVAEENEVILEVNTPDKNGETHDIPIIPSTEEKRQRAAAVILAAWRVYRLRRNRLVDTITKFQASCKGFLARRQLSMGKEKLSGQIPCEVIIEVTTPDTDAEACDVPKTPSIEEKRQHAAAVILAAWRVYRLRRNRLADKEQLSDQIPCEAENERGELVEESEVIVEVTTPDKGVEAFDVSETPSTEEKRQHAAAVILAAWRGYRLRRNRLADKEKLSDQIPCEAENERGELVEESEVLIEVTTPDKDHEACEVPKIPSTDEKRQRAAAAAVILASWREYRLRRNRFDTITKLLQASCKGFLAMNKADVADQIPCEAENERGEFAEESDVIVEVTTPDMDAEACDIPETPSIEEKRQHAAAVILAAWRGYRLRRNRFDTITKFQAACKGFLARRILAMNKEKLSDQIPCEAENERGEMAEESEVIVEVTTPDKDAEAFDVPETPSTEEKQQRAAAMIQAAWRGYQFRRNPRNMPAVVLKLRQRIAKVNQKATADQTVEARTRNGLNYLLNEKRLSHIRKGLEELDVCTRLSGNSCQRLVEAGVVEILFKLIHEMNQSLACQQVTTLATSILLNLAKFDQTRPAICNVERWLPALIDLLSKLQYLGLTTMVYSKTVLLLIVMRQNGHGEAEIKSSRMLVQKLVNFQTAYLKRKECKENREMEKLLREKGKVAVVRGDVIIRKPVKFWKKDRVNFTPDWILSNNKPNENLSKDDVTDWFLHVFKDHLKEQK